VIGELVLRFGIGGLVVSVFSIVGEVWQPKTFSGLFGAAPSVALVSMALASAKEGRGFVAESATMMVAGAIALVFYASCCAWAARIERLPVWLGAGLSWITWAAAAACAYVVIEGVR
jgi:hypothetical protein